MKTIISILIAVVLITNGTMMWRQHNIIEAQAELIEAQAEVIEETQEFMTTCGTIISLMLGDLLTEETIEKIKKIVDDLNKPLID